MAAAQPVLSSLQQRLNVINNQLAEHIAAIKSIQSTRAEVNKQKNTEQNTKGRTDTYAKLLATWQQYGKDKDRREQLKKQCEEAKADVENQIAAFQQPQPSADVTQVQGEPHLTQETEAEKGDVEKEPCPVCGHVERVGSKGLVKGKVPKAWYLICRCSSTSCKDCPYCLEDSSLKAIKSQELRFQVCSSRDKPCAICNCHCMAVKGKLWESRNPSSRQNYINKAQRQQAIMTAHGVPDTEGSRDVISKLQEPAVQALVEKGAKHAMILSGSKVTQLSFTGKDKAASAAPRTVQEVFRGVKGKARGPAGSHGPSASNQARQYGANADDPQSWQSLERDVLLAKPREGAICYDELSAKTSALLGVLGSEFTTETVQKALIDNGMDVDTTFNILVPPSLYVPTPTMQRVGDAGGSGQRNVLDLTTSPQVPSPPLKKRHVQMEVAERVIVELDSDSDDVMNLLTPPETVDLASSQPTSCTIPVVEKGVELMEHDVFDMQPVRHSLEASLTKSE